MRSICVAFLLATFVACGAARADAVDRYLTAKMAENEIPGLSVAILRQGRVVKLKTYGYADLEQRVPVTVRTVYPIASVTKTFTSTAILMLVEEGKLRLDDRVADRLPGLPASWGEVTVRQCLSHTSGLPDATPCKDELARTPDNKAALFQMLFRAPFEYPTGTRCAYNQTGFLLLGELIEKLSGRPYADFVRERLLQPAGMTETRFTEYGSPDAHGFFTPVVPHLAPEYVVQDGRLRHASFFHGAPDQPTAGLLSTLPDLVRWDQALSRGALVKRSSLEQAWTPARLKDGSPARLWWGSYGLGWFVGEQDGRRYAGHLGGNAVWYCRFPDEELSLIVLTNLEGSFPASIALDLARLPGFTAARRSVSPGPPGTVVPARP